MATRTARAAQFFAGGQIDYSSCSYAEQSACPLILDQKYSPLVRRLGRV